MFSVEEANQAYSGYREPLKPFEVEQLRQEEEKMAPGGEKDYLPSLPRTLSVDILRTSLGTLHDAADLGLGIIPYAKYAIDWERQSDVFMKMSKEEQTEALLWEAAGAGLWAAPKIVGTGIKAIGKATSAVGRSIRVSRELKYVKPIEDLAKWTETDYYTQLGKTLRSKDYGLSPLEAESVERFMRGAKRALNVPRATMGEVSKGFQSITKRTGAGTGDYGMLELSETTLEKFSPQAIRSRKMLLDYRDELFSKLKLFGAERTAALGGHGATPLDQVAFGKIMEKVYGKSRGFGMSLANASDEQLVAAREFLKSHEATSLVKRTAGPGQFGFFRRIQTGMGLGEPMYAVRSRIYDVAELGFEDAGLLKGLKLTILAKMMVQRGLQIEKSGKFAPVIGKLSRNIEARAHATMKEAHRLEQILLNAENPEIAAQTKEAIKGLLPLRTAEDFAVRDLIKTIHDFSDHLYGELAPTLIEEALMIGKTTAIGKIRIQELMKTLRPQMAQALETSANLNTIDKIEKIQDVLRQARKALYDEHLLWYDFTGMTEQAGIRTIERIGQNLVMGGKGKFHPYKMSIYHTAPAYKAGIMQVLHNEDSVSVVDKIATKYYSQLERLGMKHEMTLEQSIVKAVSAHAQYMYARPALRAAAGAARNLPPGWKKFVEYYFARKMHLPSKADAWVAGTLERTVGGGMRAAGRLEILQRAFPKANWQGIYDPYDVVNMSKAINDVTYMAFLGGRPFSAMRNLFQPWIMTAPELGGITDQVTVMRAYPRAILDPKVRAELREMGQIPGDLVGELAEAGVGLGSGAVKISAAELEAINKMQYSIFGTRNHFLKVPMLRGEELKGTLMYMFSQSHKGNCYISGTAAIIKWEDALRAVGGEAGIAKKFSTFVKKSGVVSRRDDLRAEIEVLLKQGQIREAKKVFVKSVVDATQFLYQSGSTPLITQSLGGTGRSLAVFQTWWLNYGDSIATWATTGTPQLKATRALNIAVSNYTAYKVMELMWGEGTASNTVLTGPFPTWGRLTEGPPAFQAFGNVLKTAMMAGGLFRDQRPYSERLKKQAWNTAKASFEFLPAGLQMSQSIKRTQAEGGAGFMKSLVKWKKNPGQYRWDR